jgi:hypothetical protein
MSSTYEIANEIAKDIKEKEIEIEVSLDKDNKHDKFKIHYTKNNLLYIIDLYRCEETDVNEDNILQRYTFYFLEIKIIKDNIDIITTMIKNQELIERLFELVTSKIKTRI